MDTRIIKVNDNNFTTAIQDAAGTIRSGGLVAFPTETVYGLGADATNPDASAKIYEAKGRPSDNPLIVHICDRSQLYEVASSVPPAALRLADTFWPGPLTIILPKSDIIPPETTGSLNTVAIRMPDNEIALSLIRKSGTPIAAPSANTSGRPSPTLAEHVYEDLNGRIPLILDGGPVIIGLESTIIDLSVGEPALLRPGFFSKEELLEVIAIGRSGGSSDDAASPKVSISHPKAPGMKYRHYAPNAPLIAIRGEAEAVAAKALSLAKEHLAAYPTDLSRKEGKSPHIGFLCTTETRPAFEGFAKDHPDISCTIICLGDKGDAKSIAAGFFGALRSFDKADADIIYSEYFDSCELSQAIANRLNKAAGGSVIDLRSLI